MSRNHESVHAASAHPDALDSRLRVEVTHLFMRLLAGNSSDELLALASNTAALADELEKSLGDLAPQAERQRARDLADLARGLRIVAVGRRHGGSLPRREQRFGLTGPSRARCSVAP